MNFSFSTLVCFEFQKWQLLVDFGLLGVTRMCLLQWFLLLLLGASLAAPASPTLGARAPQSTACGAIVNSKDTSVFNASLAYECLTSVPFNPAVATRFLQYYNDTLQFQSTLTYLKNPPASYQQPGVDLLGGLEELQQAINDGNFPNQYEFEAALQTLLYATHDGHVNLFAGILSAFNFASPYDIVSLSLDGVQLPKVYLAMDLFESSYFTTYQPSAIASINGIDATAYLTKFASKNSVGTLEPHADWNQLMLSAAQDVQGFFNVFSGGATFYPGDTITFTLENGTKISDRYLVIYNDPGPTGPLETGGDFYNFFVLGFYPASFDPDLSDNTTNSSASSSVAPSSTPTAAATSTVSSLAPPAPSSWNNTAYPDIPDVAQVDLGTYGGGYISGYFLNSTSTSVLSIPSFDEYGDAINTFQSTIGQFIAQSKAASLQKVVIDLQQNVGGQPLLAIDAFKQFFPNIDPFAGSRMRAHHSADVMGETMTNYWNSLNGTDDGYYILADSEWVATDRLNANTGQNFTSWAEFFGPHSYDGDTFTTTQRYNLSSFTFDVAATGSEGVAFAVYGYGANPAPPNAAPPYAAEDIIILSDGICDSSCSLFMEMMHHEAGVRVVVAGGRPSTGPMQAPSGSRGARSYATYALDANIGFTQLLLADQNSSEVTFLPNRTQALDVYVTFASINLRDQVRKDETIPLQFAYEAADCRIFYTPQTIYNYTALWQYAADAIWSKPSLCVQGSTGFAPTGTNKTDFVGPLSGTPGTFSNLTTHLNTLNTSSIPYLTSLNDGLDAAFAPRYNSKPRDTFTTKTRDCKYSGGCSGGLVCASVTTCLGSGKTGPSSRCLPKCSSSQARCRNGGRCQFQASTDVDVGSQHLQQGFCAPAANAQSCGTGATPGLVNVGPPPPSKMR
ncbi:hypothetical protein FGG08_007206 [Glutinoglossum americanum]|uniref:CPAF-like PDZ domain-containing protein n=1 Tax=Glutinoglossum americanum TaxID=1670608 RepID=A0A9P8L0A3_9PEZI|nr:hypothetical protein FGG08_007206 [Glutinoglossum americanum]